MVLAILRLPAVFGLLLALLVIAGCGQSTARHAVADPTAVTQAEASSHQAVTVVEPIQAPSVVAPVAKSLPPLLAGEQAEWEPYCPRGPPALTVLPFFPMPLILPLDIPMPSEVGLVIDRMVRGQRVVAWVAVSPVGWRYGAVRTVGFRYYNPVTGRYISRDPAGYPNGLNNYLYVNNNPINRIDPLGLGFLDGLQEVISVAGFIPFVNIASGALNTVISTCRGNFGDAAIKSDLLIEAGRKLVLVVEQPTVLH